LGKVPTALTMPFATLKSMASPRLPMANVIALADAGGVGEGEMRKVTFADGAFDFGEGDVEIGIDMNDSGFELLAVGEKREQVSSPRARWALVTMTPVPVTKKPEPELSSPFS